MYCEHCHKEYPDSLEECPYCDPEKQKKKPGRLQLSRTCVNVMMITAAAIALPIFVCLTVNIFTGITNFWSAYVIGACALVWVCVVLPFVKFIPWPLKIALSGATLSLYLLLIAFLTDGIGWYLTYFLPIVGIGLLCLAGTMALFFGHLIRPVHIPGMVLLAVSVFLGGINLVIVLNNLGEKVFPWSLICISVLLPAAALYESIIFAVHSKKKNR